LEKWRAGEGGDFGLRRWLERGRNGREIHLPKAEIADAGSGPFTTQANENGLRTGSGDAGRAGIQKAGHTADRDLGAIVRSPIRINEVHALCAKIGDDELRTVRCEREAPECGIGGWPIGWRPDGSPENLGGEIEGIDVIGGGYIELLALLIVEDEFVEARMRESLRTA
jgi:hypothetical protein